jgi:ribosomal protein L37AE/L43A
MSLLWIKTAMPAERYYHASPHEFQPGDEVVPASERMPMKYPRTAYPEGEEWRRNRVWMTGHPAHSREFYARGHVYEVQPQGEVHDHSSPRKGDNPCPECDGEGGWHVRNTAGAWDHEPCGECGGTGDADSFDPVDIPQYHTDRARVVRKVEPHEYGGE